MSYRKLSEYLSRLIYKNWKQLHVIHTHRTNYKIEISYKTYFISPRWVVTVCDESHRNFYDKILCNEKVLGGGRSHVVFTVWTPVPDCHPPLPLSPSPSSLLLNSLLGSVCVCGGGGSVWCVPAAAPLEPRKLRGTKRNRPGVKWL